MSEKKKVKLLMVDNYDSFTYNLVQYFGQLGVESTVIRNDELSLDAIAELNPELICISPGPCTPSEAGVSCGVVERFGKTTPILGVCLGHQSIGQVFGANVVRAEELMHGKTSDIEHTGESVFATLESPLRVTRYHSLVVERESLPDCLKITAETSDGVIMGLMHKEYPIHGVQFHPESILTQSGMDILGNFLKLAKA